MKHNFVLIAVWALLFGCAVKPEPRFEELKELSAPRISGELIWNRTPEDASAIDVRVSALLENGVTRQDAVQIALLNNRALQASLDRLGVAEAEFVQAGLFTNPTFGAFLGFPLANGQSDLGLSVFLSDLWQVPARKKMAAADVEATIREVGTVVVSTASDAASAFDSVLLRQVLAKLAEEGVELAAAVYTRQEIRYQHGLTLRPTVESARAQRADSRIDLAEAEEALVGARTALDTVLSLRGEDSNYTIVGDLAALPKTDWQATDAISFALDNRHDIARNKAEVQSAARAITYQKTLIFRTASAGAAYQGAFAGGSQNNNWGPTFGLEVPIFDQNQAQIAKAEYLLSQREKALEGARVIAQTQILDALALYKASEVGVREIEDKVIPELDRAVAFSEQWSKARQLDLLEQLTLEQSRLAAKRELAWEQKHVRQADVLLHRALWGGNSH